MIGILTAAILCTTVLSSSTKSSHLFLIAEASDYNNEVVSNLLANVDSVCHHGEAYATFDWDNTCVYGDISSTTFFYQVDNLNFRFAPENFSSIFSLGYDNNSFDTCLAEGTNTVIGQDVDGSNVTLVTALAETARDYEVLYKSYIAPTYNLNVNRDRCCSSSDDAPKNVSLSEIKETDEFQNFRAKIAFVLNSLQAMNGSDDHSDCAMTIAMTALPHLLVGMKTDEIQALIRASIRWNLGQGLETPTYTSTSDDLKVKGSYTKGLRFYEGQKSIMRALRASDVDVYVISASPELFVAEAVEYFGLDSVVPRKNVYGVRFKTDDAGLFTAELEDNYPITWGVGKAKIIHNILQPRHGGLRPIYASGDSNGDCEMLATVHNGVVNTNNRLTDDSSCINRFYVKACKYFGKTEPKKNNAYLLQGQDQTSGTWIASGFSTEDGITYKSAVNAYHGCARYQLLDL